MQYSHFPRSERRVSRLCFGAMGLNCAFGTFAEADLIKTVHRALERGVNMVDTARTYADSEQILGRALKQWRGEKPFVCTKVAPQPSPTNAGWGLPNPIDVAYPKGAVTASAETSLRLLGIDCIDLLQLHQFWGQYEGDGHWLEEMVRLREQGKVRHLGVSCVDHRADMALSIVKSGLIDSVQTIINIFDPLAFDTLVPLCEQHQVAVIARCVLDEGGLTGFLTEHTRFDALDFRDNYFEHGPLSEYVRRVEALREYVPRDAPSLAALALRFALHHPGVTTAAVSLHVPEHLEENIAAVCAAPLPDAAFDEIRKHHRWLVNLYQGKYFPSSGEVSASGFKRAAAD
jgi:aryl-alcohol dehydrogenase-like predicted oxidoreductase